MEVVNILSELRKGYEHSTEDKRIKLVDFYLLFIVLTAVAQFGYCALVGTYPFNSFLSGFIACVGSFALTGM
jgi:dolichyl-diphosphooligosaccharide---protein glycosyltransferase subunit DAD1/OST2